MHDGLGDLVAERVALDVEVRVANGFPALAREEMPATAELARQGLVRLDLGPPVVLHGGD
jgi:hypothetical protein